MTLLDYSVVLVPGDPENVNDLNTMLGEIRAIVNHLQNDNIAGDAAIAYSKLNIPDGAIPHTKLAQIAASRLAVPNGQLLVGQAGGYAQNVGLSGPLSIGSGGATALRCYAQATSGFTALATDGVSWGGVTGLHLTPPAGTYLAIVKLSMWATQAAVLKARLGYNFGVYDEVAIDVVTTGLGKEGVGVLLAPMALDGVNAVDVQAVATMAGGSASAGVGMLALIGLS